LRPHEEHRRHAPRSVKVSLITVSTSRYGKIAQGVKVSDESGSKALKSVEEAGNKVISTKIVDDNIFMIRHELLRSLFKDGADVAILMGGTGISERDVTIEAVRPLIDKELEGFAEIFRARSYNKIGTPAYLSRCIAGRIAGKMVYCLPGSPQAVVLGCELIIPELSHAVHIAGL
jgi:molybdenum cofactor biosynthesis protein B